MPCKLWALPASLSVLHGFLMCFTAFDVQVLSFALQVLSFLLRSDGLAHVPLQSFARCVRVCEHCLCLRQSQGVGCMQGPLLRQAHSSQCFALLWPLFRQFVVCSDFFVQIPWFRFVCADSWICFFRFVCSYAVLQIRFFRFAKSCHLSET